MMSDDVFLRSPAPAVEQSRANYLQIRDQMLSVYRDGKSSNDERTSADRQTEEAKVAYDQTVMDWLMTLPLNLIPVHYSMECWFLAESPTLQNIYSYAAKHPDWNRGLVDNHLGYWYWSGSTTWKEEDDEYPRTIEALSLRGCVELMFDDFLSIHHCLYNEEGELNTFEDGGWNWGYDEESYDEVVRLDKALRSNEGNAVATHLVLLMRHCYWSISRVQMHA